MNSISSSINSVTQNVVKIAKALVTSTAESTQPQTQTSANSLFPGADTFVPSSQDGLGDLNEAISRNRKLREEAFKANGRTGGEMVFGEQIPTSTSGAQRVGRGLVKITTGLVTTQLDSPLPGPADAIGAGIVSSGVKDVGLGLTQMLMSTFPVQPRQTEEEECKSAHAVHRAVGPNERKSIDNLNMFSPNPSGLEGKYFYPSPEQAVDFAHSRTNANKPEMWRATGVIPHGLPHDHIDPVGEGPAIFVTNPDLPGIKHAKVREQIKPK